MTDRSRLLLDSAIAVLKGSVGGFKEVGVKPYNRYLDKRASAALKSGFLSQSSTKPLTKEITMAKAKPVVKTKVTDPDAVSTKNEGADTPAANTIVEHEDGSTEILNPTPKTKAEADTEAALAKIKAKADKKAAAEAKKAEAEAKRNARNEQIRANKEARAARLESMTEGTERTYTGPMLALADRVKQGVYVKSGTGQLRSNDELALALDLVPVDNVIQLAKIVLELPENPYTKLNAGQQSMNLRNRMRGALKKGTLTISRIREVIAAEGFDTYKGHAEKVAAEKEAKAKAKAEKEAAKAKADADAAAKAKEPETETA